VDDLFKQMETMTRPPAVRIHDLGHRYDHFRAKMLEGMVRPPMTFRTRLPADSWRSFNEGVPFRERSVFIMNEPQTVTWSHVGDAANYNVCADAQ
jgi:hypothetical protein